MTENVIDSDNNTSDVRGITRVRPSMKETSIPTSMCDTDLKELKKVPMDSEKEYYYVENSERSDENNDGKLVFF